MAGVKILITNHALDQRSGSELYVRDLAVELLRQGQQPVVYSRVLGEVAAEIREQSIPVVSDLTEMAESPDVIHAQHHLEAMTAVSLFDRVPAIYVCHGWLPHQEAPPRHPNFLRYLAVDDLVRSRLIDECGVDPSIVETHRNFFDPKLFPRRSELPDRPRRALVFSNQTAESRALSAIAAACKALDLTLDVVGRSMGTQVLRPGEVLGDYDVVFAKGRAALEAAATGCAVILSDRAGLGPTLSPSNYLEARRFNFGLRLLRDRHSESAVGARLDAYDPAQAEEVTDTVRREATITPAVERLVGVYRHLARQSHPDAAGSEARARAIHDYLRNGPLSGDRLFRAEQEKLRSEFSKVQHYAQDLERHARQLRTELDSKEADVAALESTREELRTRIETESARAERAIREASGLESDLERLCGERDEALRGAEAAHAELGWMRATRVWRLRAALLRRSWVRWAYRALASKR